MALLKDMSSDIGDHISTQVKAGIAELQRKLNNALTENSMLRRTTTEQQDKLKLCRNAMRAAGIGEQYPGANPRIEQDWKDPDKAVVMKPRKSTDQDSDYFALREVLIHAQADAARWKAESDELRSYCEFLELKMTQHDPNFVPQQIETFSHAPQLIANEILKELEAEERGEKYSAAGITPLIPIEENRDGRSG